MGSATIQQRIAVALASVVLVASIIVVAVRAGDDEDTVALPSPTASPAETASPGTTPKATRSPAASAAASPTNTPATTAARPAATELPEGQVVPPRPGTYRYRETTNGDSSDWTLEVADRGSNRYTESLNGELTNDVLWRSDGKYVDRSTFGDPPAGFECDWAPDTRELKLPFADGSSWRFSGRCEPAPNVSISFKGTSRITGMQRIAVGGQQIDTWAINTTASLTFRTPEGSGTQNVSSQDRFSAEHGLYVRSTEKTTGEDPQTGQNTSETTTRQLLSLRPS